MGTVCVVKDQEKNYRRARVVLVMDNETDDAQYRVFCIDFGDMLIRPGPQLYVLPEHLCTEVRSSICVRLYVSCLKPVGVEPCFSSKARMAVKQFIGKTFTGKVSNRAFIENYKIIVIALSDCSFNGD